MKFFCAGKINKRELVCLGLLQGKKHPDARKTKEHFSNTNFKLPEGRIKVAQNICIVQCHRFLVVKNVSAGKQFIGCRGNNTAAEGIPAGIDLRSELRLAAIRRTECYLIASYISVLAAIQ